MIRNPETYGIIAAARGFFWTPAAAKRCSVCVSGANDPTADAYGWSVLFLMATPYLVVGSIAGELFIVYRRGAAQQEQTAAQRKRSFN